LRTGKNYIFGAVAIVSALDSSVAPAQTFQSYRCADAPQSIVGFFAYDKRAHLQIDGKAVTLGRRFALSGSRYSGRGITLKISQRATPSSMPDVR
jgi:membrane-bound inhibitor of C-type lysozyme